MNIHENQLLERNSNVASRHLMTADLAPLMSRIELMITNQVAMFRPHTDTKTKSEEQKGVQLFLDQQLDNATTLKEILDKRGKPIKFEMYDVAKTTTDNSLERNKSKDTS